MKLAKLFLALFIITIFPACISSTMNGIMESWKGAHIEEVISQWGYPTSQRQFRGRTLYDWAYSKSVTMPQSTNITGEVIGNSVFAQATTYGGNTVHGSCIRTLEVDSSGTVVNWQWNGNNCPFAELMEYSNWRRRGYKAPERLNTTESISAPERVNKPESIKMPEESTVPSGSDKIIEDGKF